MTARDALDGMKARLEAATPGPWAVDECTPCTERGRLEVNIYDAPGNLMVTGWCDDDEFHRPDAEFIAAAPTDVARLIDAVEAVLARLDEWDSYKAWPDAEETQVWYSAGKRHASEAIRALITEALEESQ